MWFFSVVAALCVASSCANITRAEVPDEATDWRSDFFRKNPNISLESLVVILHDDHQLLPTVDFFEDNQVNLKAIWPGGLMNWKDNREGWPEVPYRFRSDDVIRSGIEEAMQHWEGHTCLKFRDDQDGGLYPHLVYQESEDECSSKIGRKFYVLMGQSVLLTKACQLDVGTVIHEIGHALGLFHEHARFDRSGHVQVVWKNMLLSEIFNYVSFITETYGVPYDLTSLMHYGPLSFSRDGGSVLVTTDPMAQGLIGNRDVLSHMDKRLVNIQYGCVDKWVAGCSLSSDPCEHDGYLWADCSCVCPAGTSGDQCQHRDMDYTEALIAELLPYNAEVTTETTISSPNYPTPLQDGTRFTTRITAPENKKVSIKFNDFDMGDRCSRLNTCCFDGLEIRLNGDVTSGTWYCGKEISASQEFVSENNVLVFFYHSYDYKKYFLTSSHKGYEAVVTFI